jgi:hypothetical protein
MGTLPYPRVGRERSGGEKGRSAASKADHWPRRQIARQ